jgi:DtxR family Mn-dependent transcriptional regulator
MSSVHSMSSFKRRAATSPSDGRPLADLPAGTHGVIVEVCARHNQPVDRLLALGVLPGASITVMQTFPGVVFRCDQTELAVERAVARSIIVRVMEADS